MPRVGKYELGKTVGRGAFSKVKVATHVETQREVVIKIIDKRGAQDKSEQRVEEEVKHEISIMKVLNHENIVRMFEVMESSKHFYIVLESVRGGDLCDHVMEQGKLAEKQSQKYLHHLVEGLIACHAAGVAHRDVKPENCLISTDGVLKVADFGLSRLHRGRGTIADSTELSTDSVGTLSYAAPEVLDGRYNAFLADLWSVGVVIFVMLTGKFPFGSKGHTEAQIQQDIRKARINKFPSHMSAEAKHLIQNLIVVNPPARLGLEQILDHPWLETEMAGSPRAAGKLPSIVSAAGSSGRRRPQTIDVDRVQAEAKAAVAAGSVIEDAMSPKWQESPEHKRPTRSQPELFSPQHRDGKRAVPPAAAAATEDLAALKASLEQDAHRLAPISPNSPNS